MNQIITVPREKCPLSVLSGIGKHSENACFFLDCNAVVNLKKKASYFEVISNVYYLYFKKDKSDMQTIVSIRKVMTPYFQVLSVDSPTYSFRFNSKRAKNLFFLKQAIYLETWKAIAFQNASKSLEILGICLRFEHGDGLFVQYAKKERVKIAKFLLFLGANEVVIYNFFGSLDDWYNNQSSYI